MVERKILDSNLSSLPGQEMAKELVAKSLLKGDCSTYLLVGPPRVGKGRLARVIAASLHGSGDINKPHLDTIIFDDVLEAKSGESEENKWKQAVDEAVHLINLSPSHNFRVLIIDEIDRLNMSAANALLKTLEEPPIHAKIIITAQNIGAVLPTIRSRAQIIRLNSLADEEIEAYLKKQQVKSSDIVTLLANGALELADELVSDSDKLKTYEQQLAAFKALISREVVAGMAVANVKERAEALQLVGTWANLSRRLLRARLQGQPVGWLGEMKQLPDTLALTKLISRLQEASDALSGGANIRIVLEALVLGAAVL